MNTAKERNEKSSPEKIKSINEALSLLNSAAKDAGEEIKEILQHDYRSLQHVLSDAAPEVKETFRNMKDRSFKTLARAKDQIKDVTQETAKSIDNNVHKNPWTFMAASSMATLAMGFYLGRKFQKR